MSDAYDPPRAVTGDRAYAIAKGAVGAIPVLGGVIAEVFGMVLVAPLERRRDEWMERVANALRRLEERQPGRLEALSGDPTFTSVLLQATQAAYRSHREEKTRLLLNAVRSGAEGIDVGGDLQMTFVRYVDEMTPTHVFLLRVLAEHEPELRAQDSYQALYDVFVGHSGLQPTKDQFHLLIDDLRSRMLLRLARSFQDFEDVQQASYMVLESDDKNPFFRVTELGRQFLTFVSENRTSD
jgi:hypothetical protein